MTLSSCNGTILRSGIGISFEYGYVYSVDDLCLEAGLGGLIVEVDGGAFPSEVSWSLTFPSGVVEIGVAGSWESGLCVSPYPSPQPSVTLNPTALCELYMVELSDSFGDG